MTEWTAHLWGANQADGKIPTFSATVSDGLVAAAISLAHFALLADRPIITLDSRIELNIPNSGEPDHVYSVHGILGYLKEQPHLLYGSEDDKDHLRALENLAKELGV